MAQQTVEAGLVSSFFDFLGKIFDNLDGIEVEDKKDVKNEDDEVIGFSFTAVTANKDKVHVKLLDTAGRKNLYDMYCLSDTGKKHKYPHITDKQIDDCIQDFVENTYKDSPSTVEDWEETSEDDAFDVDDEGFDTNSSKKLQVTLSKVQGSNEITFGPIFCNYNSLEAYEDIENVLDSDEFVDELTEDPQCFEIVPSEEEYDVIEIDEVQPMTGAAAILQAQFNAVQFLYGKYGLAGLSNALHYISTIRWQIDWLIDSKFITYDESVDVKEILKLAAEDYLRDYDKYGDKTPEDIVEDYCCILDMYYPNFPHEIQKLFDEWLLTLRNYSRPRCYF